MSELDDRLKRLGEELDALKRIKTQEEYDEGARLHNEKNAPWVSGMYSHLRFDPYVYQEYPKAMYSRNFLQARREVHDARYLSGVTDQERQAAIKEAERVMNLHVALVTNASEEHLRLGAGWHSNPDTAASFIQRDEKELEIQAAHLAFEDRRLGEKAKAERDAADDASEGHLVEVPIKRKPGRPASVSA